MITLCKCGAMTTPGEKYCKSCYIDTLKDDVSKNIFAGGRFYERRDMREEILKILSVYADCHAQEEECSTCNKTTDRIIALIYSEIEKVDNPYPPVYDPEFYDVKAGFENCRYKILSLLRPNNVVGNAEL